jgi:DNA-binding transcriptional MerR regulator
MPTQTKPKPETWLDWMPEGSTEPEHLLTRDEVVDLLSKRHVAGTEPISAGDLRYWESIGVLPHPIRRWRDGAPRALYHPFAWLLAREVRMKQRAGFALDEIRPQIRALARNRLAYGEKAPRLGPRTPEEIVLWPDLVNELERLARYREAVTSVPTERIEVLVVGTDGLATKYPLPIALPDEE